MPSLRSRWSRGAVSVSAACFVVLAACATPPPSDVAQGSFPVPPVVTSTGVPIRALPVEGASAVRIVDVAGGVAVGWAERPADTGIARQALAISIVDGTLLDLGTADVARAEADHIAGSKVTGSLVREDGTLGMFVVDLVSGSQGRPDPGEALAPASFAGPGRGPRPSQLRRTRGRCGDDRRER